VTDNIIETSALTKTYAGASAPAVNGLDLTVRRGEIFGLLGPNGAGKTTTAGILTTRVVPTSGHASIAGIDVVKHPALVKQISGIVSQQNTLDRQLTVWENLYFHGRLFGFDKKTATARSNELLETFTLTKWGKASVYALSGGMAQRLMVARAVFHNPAVLFLDEPTAGLDPQSRLALWALLQELNKQGQTVMLTTHYMEEADQLCHRVAIMDHGKILALDTPANLKKSTGTDTLATIKVASNASALEAAVLSLDGVLSAKATDNVVVVHTQQMERMVPRLVDVAEKANVDILDLAVTEPSLETVFINLTGKELREV
jgi:ABC-2 type transport system ATP-binding protein